MNIGFITNSRAPYRIKQINKLIEIEGIDFTIYYTKKKDDRLWEIAEKCKVKEIFLKGVELFKFSNIDFYINSGICKAVKSNDLIIIGGYEQPSYLLASIFCKILGKKYIIFFDGIQPQKINSKINILKRIIIKYIVCNSFCIFANGKTSKLYFTNNFNYSKERIYNQYLTVDIDEIQNLNTERFSIKNHMMERYKINVSKKIILFVGRLLFWKNVEVLIKAVSLMKDKENYVLVIVGDGPEKENLQRLSDNLSVNTVYTGNISNRTDIIYHYYMSDLFVFPTSGEAWGLVVNEALAAGLPVICSNAAGACLDLVIDGVNGYTFDHKNPEELCNKISLIFAEEEKYKSFCLASKEIIKDWNFDNSKKSFFKMLQDNGLLKEIS